jgi:hypothetical protein
MSYNITHLSTAGRATVLTVLMALGAFALVFFLNLGSKEFKQAVAQNPTATTSVTVVNTPPVFFVDAEESTESSGTLPTNSGSVVAFTATAVDANAESYFLLICNSTSTPIANPNAPPTCGVGATQWARSATTTSGSQAIAATTTLETASSLFDESNVWYAFVCDFNAGTPRCSTDQDQQGNGSTASPFHVNDRPVFTMITNNGPVNPDGTLTFTATSSDPNTVPTNDTVQLIVCSTAVYATTTNTCGGTTLATSTFSASNPTASFTLVPPYPDTNYNAYPFIIDNHGHEASSTYQGTTTTFTVNNVAPYIQSVSLNGGTNIILDTEAGQSVGYTIDFVVGDFNSCQAVGSTTEITNYQLSVYRDGTANSSTTCGFVAGDYNPNDCYPSVVATTTWNLSCTASTTACSGPTDQTTAYSCTFPLWFVADPTDGTATSTQYSADNWKAQVRAVDDDFATGTPSQSASGVELLSFLAIDLLDFFIPYGSLEPGQDSDDAYANLGAGPASTTVQATGNVGLDTNLLGTSMCPTYTGGTPCNNSATSTIDDFRQVFTATSSATYASASTSGNNLSSTTAKELELNVPKSTATTTPATAKAYWGILIPGTISLSGDYTGRNTYIAVQGESAQW